MGLHQHPVIIAGLELIQSVAQVINNLIFNSRGYIPAAARSAPRANVANTALHRPDSPQFDRVASLAAGKILYQRI